MQEQYQLALLPSIVCAASKRSDGSYSCPERTERRLRLAELKIERQKDKNHRTEAERFRAATRSGEMLSLQCPLHIVQIETGDDESYLLAMSPGAIADWFAEYVNPRQADGVRHSNKLHVVERDTGNHGYRVPQIDGRTIQGEIAATRAHCANRSGLSRLQSAFRSARLDSPDPLPTTRERRIVYGPDNSNPEAICYRALFDGSLDELERSEEARDGVVSYLFDQLDGEPSDSVDGYLFD